MFPIHVNDIPQAVKSNLSLNADYSCLAFQGNDVREIEKQLTEDFTNICGWFVDNTLSRLTLMKIRQSVILASKHKIKKVPKLNITYKYIQIEQHSKVTYAVCIFDEAMLGDSVTDSKSNLNFYIEKTNF